MTWHDIALTLIDYEKVYVLGQTALGIIIDNKFSL